MTMETTDARGAVLTDAQLRSPLRALPFWISLSLPVIGAVAAYLGGWWVVLMPLYTWGAYSLLDRIAGEDEANADPNADRAALTWYRAITLVWPFVQFASIFGIMAWALQAPHLGGWELVGLFFGVGVMSGTIGINYAHELIHQRSRLERFLGDWLLAMALYSHFRSEHLLVHHRYVATPRDPVTARYGESFYRFYPRVLWQCVASAFRAERDMLARKGHPWWHRTNPFWRYLAFQGAMVAVAALIGGWVGVGLFAFQAVVAAWQLELVNYIEHYGLARREVGEIGGGRYEPVRPRHSWNSAHRISNWLLINLQRHSDHHYKPDRPFPLLQTYDEDEAPQLPQGYAAMTVLALFPPLFRRVMHPRVEAWRARHYPDITEWDRWGRPVEASANPL